MSKNTLAETNKIMNDYGFKSSWRVTDNSTNDLLNATDPKNSSKFLWQTLPNIFILETATMKIVKASQIDGFSLDVVAEVTALNK